MFVLISNNSMMSLVKKTGHVDFFRPLINPFFILYANMHFKMWDQGFALLFCRIKDYSLITWIKMKLRN